MQHLNITTKCNENNNYVLFRETEININHRPNNTNIIKSMILTCSLFIPYTYLEFFEGKSNKITH